MPICDLEDGHGPSCNAKSLVVGVSAKLSHNVIDTKRPFLTTARHLLENGP